MKCITSNSSKSPFCILSLDSELTAHRLISRSVLGKGIYELWGTGSTYEDLHTDVSRRSRHLWPQFMQSSFRITVDGFQGSKKPQEQLDVFESFSYLNFQGPIRMKAAEVELVVFEEYDVGRNRPRRLFFGRLIAPGGRDAVTALSLKTRNYISTTSMDAELALLAANLTLAAPGRLLYDPFVGTGSLTLAGAHFGALVVGSDIDGRSIRGTKKRNLASNFEQYALGPRHLDSFISDLTHSPLRNAPGGWMHAIMCDPPYGVREGLKVLGSKDRRGKEALLVDGIPAHE